MGENAGYVFVADAQANCGTRGGVADFVASKLCPRVVSHGLILEMPKSHLSTLARTPTSFQDGPTEHSDGLRPTGVSYHHMLRLVRCAQRPTP